MVSIHALVQIFVLWATANCTELKYTDITRFVFILNMRLCCNNLYAVIVVNCEHLANILTPPVKNKSRSPSD